jgi:hypothetical protein
MGGNKDKKKNPKKEVKNTPPVAKKPTKKK